MSKSPVAIIILDGFGWREDNHGNAVNLANKPNFDRYWAEYPHSTMKASGLEVGLPEGQMGNSEVGHTNIGAGRIVYQSITRIDKAIQDGEYAKNEVLLDAFDYVNEHESALHLIGLVSDGGVHSHQRQLNATIQEAKKNNVEKIYIHVFTDGRDVAPNSAVGFIQELQDFLAEEEIGEIATITGRYYAMDRDNRWERVQKAYDAIYHGVGNKATDPVAAVKASYAEDVYDEFILPIVVEKDDAPVATIQDNDVVLFFNFRPDRAIQLSKAISQDTFEEFDRGERPKGTKLVTMTNYTNEMDATVLFKPQYLDNMLGKVLSDAGKVQVRVAETEKYPHVTFFLNGGVHEEFPGEKRILIPSPDVATYDLKPEMSAYEVADALIEGIEDDQYDAIVLNFANPDMVGHSGMLEPTIKAVEATDDNLGRVVDKILEKDGYAIIFADHGNSDTVINADGTPNTAHTTVPVPVIVTKKGISLRKDGKLADVAPTMLELLGIEQPEEMTGESLIIKD